MFGPFFISHDHVTGFFFHSPIFVLFKSNRFMFSDFFNIKLDFNTCRNILILRFFTCYSSHLYVHFRMHSPSVDKPNFGEDFLFHFHPSALGLSNTTPYLFSPLKYHGAAPHHFIPSLPSTVQQSLTGIPQGGPIVEPSLFPQQFSPLLLSHRASWLLRCLSTHHTLVLLSSSQCAALSLSYPAGWLLCGGSLTKFLPIPQM